MTLIIIGAPAASFPSAHPELAEGLSLSNGRPVNTRPAIRSSSAGPEAF